MKKHNIRDGFEDVYLRSNIVKRDASKADPKILVSKEFNRICLYMAKNFFDGNSYVFLTSGFDFEDVLSVVKVYGATFVGSGYTIDTKFNQLIMMRYISQRMSRFVGWSKKKFNWDFSEQDEEYVGLISSKSDENAPKISRDVSGLKAKVAKDPLAYREKLIHFSTSDFAPDDVKRAARRYCKKYGIEY